MTQRAWIVSALLLTLAPGCHPTPEPGTSRRDGQWVWSVADSSVLARARRDGFDAAAGVWVATIRVVTPGDSLTQTLALPPSTGGEGTLVAVVRLESSIDRWWAGRSDAAAAREIDTRLARLIDLLDRSGRPIAELQLDYDCPVRLLPRWAGVLRQVRGSSLAGREVWITSLVVHQRDPAFGRRLRGAVDGQVVQLFDTGDPATEARLAELERLLPRQGIPFRVGLGAFERHLQGRTTTDHLAWFSVVDRFRRLPGYSGLWIFPAGYRYERLLASSR